MRKLFLLLALLVPSLAWGQGSRIDGVVQGLLGPIPNQFVAVCTQPANISTAPCSTLANLYTDITLTTLCNGTNGCSNPIQTDFFGNYHFYAATGKYTVQSYGPQIQTPYVQRDVILPCDPDNCTLHTVFFDTLIHNSSDVATTGTIRLEHPDTMCWRNFLNTNDLCLSVDNTDTIQFPGGFGGGGGGTTITFNGTPTTPTVNFSDTVPPAAPNFVPIRWNYSAGQVDGLIPGTGTGLFVCTSTGPITPGHIVVFDANSNCVDGGVPPSAFVQAVTVTGCTLANGTYNECTVTADPVWPIAFANTSYKLVCTISGTFNQGGSKQSYILYRTTKTTTGFTLTLQGNRGSTGLIAQPIDCVGVQ